MIWYHLVVLLQCLDVKIWQGSKFIHLVQMYRLITDTVVVVKDSHV